MNIEHLEVPEGAVILLHDRDGEFSEEAVAADLFSELHERFPKSLVIVLAGDSTLETRPQDELELLLRDLIAHKEHFAQK